MNKLEHPYPLTEHPTGAGFGAQQSAVRHGNGSLRFKFFDWMVLAMAIAFQFCYFSQKLNSPWTGTEDFNGAVWSQAGHNFVTLGVKGTVGVPVPFYYGPTPVPDGEYYNHHPPLLALTIAGAFKIFGEHEWAARLVPVASSMASLVLLWLFARSCAGSHVAALCAAIFAFLPMELHWGQMVNFEPYTLMWMLVGFVGFRQWHLKGGRRWWVMMIGGFTLSMLTAWMGYILVLILCVDFLAVERKRYARTGFLLLGIALVTFGLFRLQLHLAQPGSFSDVMDAFRLRAGRSDGAHTFTIPEWGSRVGLSLLRHLPLPFLVLAVIGCVTMIYDRESSKFGLVWISGCFFITNAIYDIAFRNASFIHDYASFYFVVPVAIMGGRGLASIPVWIGKKYPLVRPLEICALISLILLALGFTGYRSAQNLRMQARVLDGIQAEPPDLIPRLGRFIKEEFPADMTILANFDQYFTPQLYYYARTDLANGIMDRDDWEYYISESHEHLGGIIWLGDKNAADILTLFKPGSTHIVNIENVSFCIWKSEEKQEQSPETPAQ
jgi:hypothetical protein